MFPQKLTRVFAPLADTFAAEAKPGPAFFNDAVCCAEIEQITLEGNALTVNISTSASWKGAATLFFTILTFVRLPTVSSPL